MAVRGPQLQLGVADRTQTSEVVVSARIEIQTGQGLRVASIESLGQTDHGGERAHGPAERAGKISVPLVRFLRRRLAMVPREERNHFNLVRLEAP